MLTLTELPVDLKRPSLQIHLREPLIKLSNRQFTVIKNGKFSTIIPYDDKRVRLFHCCIPLNFLDFKDLKKLKKANEGRKGQMKGQNI